MRCPESCPESNPNYSMNGSGGVILRCLRAFAAPREFPFSSECIVTTQGMRGVTTR